MVAQPVAFHPTQDPISSVDVCHALSGGSKQGTASAAVAVGTDCYNGAITGEVAATIGTPGSSVNASGPTVMTAMQVRRLTPVECERLQGFPDGYTNIPWRKKDEAPDGPRYKALGNSMAVPCMQWIGERIAKVTK
jgi:DNA (cytosine-5)-methyltransferase 1